jgi:hypothetical protein
MQGISEGVGAWCLDAVRRFDGQQQSLESLQDMIVRQGSGTCTKTPTSLPIYQGSILVREYGPARLKKQEMGEGGEVEELPMA